MRTYRIPLVMLAALLMLTIATLTASAVHYAASSSSGALGSATPRESAPTFQIDSTPHTDCTEIRLSHLLRVRTS